jgi:hypothetical protein|tara:strand:- start:56 stop:406 length:351 start_codon:yes stop_codon:yes gene_type:complete
MKDNKLIAEFMGYPPMTDVVDDRTIAYDVGGSVMNINNTHNENDDNVFHPDDMKFHTSWDWLIPVVNKIEMECEGVPIQLLDCNLYSEIGEVYQAVVEFIKDQVCHVDLEDWQKQD